MIPQNLEALNVVCNTEPNQAINNKRMHVLTEPLSLRQMVLRRFKNNCI